MTSQLKASSTKCWISQQDTWVLVERIATSTRSILKALTWSNNPSFSHRISSCLHQYWILRMTRRLKTFQLQWELDAIQKEKDFCWRRDKSQWSFLSNVASIFATKSSFPTSETLIKQTQKILAVCHCIKLGSPWLRASSISIRVNSIKIFSSTGRCMIYCTRGRPLVIRARLRALYQTQELLLNYANSTCWW